MNGDRFMVGASHRRGERSQMQEPEEVGAMIALHAKVGAANELPESSESVVTLCSDTSCAENTLVTASFRTSGMLTVKMRFIRFETVRFIAPGRPESKQTVAIDC